MENENRLVKAKEVEEIFNYEVSIAEKDPLDAFDSAILNAATVDAVEVVRCKDCKFCKRDHTLDGGGDEYYYCWHDVMEHGQARVNEFCCYGEKRTDGTAQIQPNGYRC